MKGNFSRLTRPGAPADFSRVLLQQGRVLLDSDWNDLVALLDGELRRRTRLLVGDAGYPAQEGGFEIAFKAGIELNSGGPADGQYDQTISIRRRPSLPFRETGIDQPYSIRLEYLLPASGCCGDAPRAVLLAVPGRYSIEVEPDRCLLVYGPDHREGPWLRLGPVAADKLQFVHVAWDGASRLLFWTSSEALGSPERCEEIEVDERWLAQAAPSRTALSLGGDQRGDSHLRFTFARLDIWDGRLKPGNDPLRLEQTATACRSVCALDPSSVKPKREPNGALIADASGSGNDGWLALLHADQALPPVRLLDVDIGAGHYFLAGLHAHNPAPVRFEQQPWVRAPLQSSDSSGERTHLFYLESWERFVSALQYPGLVEPALGGPDTTARTQLVWQVRELSASSLTEARRRLEVRQRHQRERGQLRFHRPTHAAGQAGNCLYRVEVHDPGWALSAARTHADASPISVERVTSRTVYVRDPEIAELLAPQAPVALLHAHGEPFVTHVTGRLGNGRFELARLPEHLSGELRLLPIATFKWSKENGAVAFPVRSIDGGHHRADAEHTTQWTALLDNAGYNGLDLQAGDYLELTDDAQDLARRGGVFFRLASIDEAQLELSLVAARPLGRIELGQAPVLRRWSGHQEGSGLPAPLRLVGGSQLLEQEIYVEFEGSGFYSGAAWWVVPVRDDAGDGLLWPEGRYLPPQGLELHVGELGALELGPGRALAHDLRIPFGSLTELTRSGRSPRESQRPDGATFIDRLLHQVWGGRACLLVEGAADLAGLERTGIRVEGRSVRAEGWQTVEAGESPRGPGVALLWQSRPTFVGEACSWLDERGTWQPSATLGRRIDFAACAFGSQLLVIGGREAAVRDARLLSGISLLEGPRSTEWRELTPNGTWVPTCGLAAVTRQDKVHLLGGMTADGVQKTHYVFDPKTGSLTRAADMPTRRKNFAALMHDGLLYVLGGCDANDGYLATVECWDATSDTWRSVPPLDEGAGPPASADLAAVSIREGIVVAGGFDGSAKSEAWLLLPALRRWQALAPLALARSRHGLITTSCWREPDRPAVYAIGGVEERRSVTQIEALPLTRSFEVMRPNRRSEKLT